MLKYTTEKVRAKAISVIVTKSIPPNPVSILYSNQTKRSRKNEN
jgi:hypothetical protein